MFLPKTWITCTGLASLFILASAEPSALTAEPSTSPSRKDAPPASIREVGRVTSLPGAATRLTFSLDGKLLIVENSPPPPERPRVLGSGVFINQERKPTIRFTVWNLSSRAVAHLKPLAHSHNENLLSPDARTLATWNYEWQGRGNAVLKHEFHDLGTQRQVARPKAWKWLGRELEPLAFSPDGKTAATKLPKNAGIGLFDAADGKEISKITRSDNRWVGPLPGVVFSGDGKVLAVPLMDTNDLTLYDVVSGKELRKLGKFDQGSVLAINGDGKRIAVGNPRSTEVQLWDGATGKQMATWEGHKPGVYDLVFSADGKLLFAAGDKVILVWDVANEREIARLRGHSSAVSVLAVSPDGKRLASGGADRSVRLWDIGAHAAESKSRDSAP